MTLLKLFKTGSHIDKATTADGLLGQGTNPKEKARQIIGPLIFILLVLAVIVVITVVRSTKEDVKIVSYGVL